MARYKSKSNKIAIGVLFVLVAILAIGLVTALFRTETQINTETLTSINYEVGAITEEGKETASTGCIRTKTTHNVEGLSIKQKSDSNVSYKLYLYDKDEVFLTSVSDVSSISNVEGATSFRLVITPAEEVEISYFDIGTYSGQLMVTFDK